jgi:hypothetical protein
MDRLGPHREPTRGGWFLRDVLGPFLFSRLALLLVAWFARQFPREARYPDPEAVARSWQNVPWRWLDVWGRWDTSWYLSIAEHGYTAAANAVGERDIAFFPAYPLLVRAVAHVIPGEGVRALYLAGLLASNLLAVGALALLWLLARDLLRDETAAGRAVLYALAFPAGFILSCVYSESLFLFLGLAAFRFGLQRRWALAGLAGFFLALTRPVGVLFFLPLALMSWEAAAQEGRRAAAGAAFLLLVPAGLAAWALYGWHLTGDPFAVFHAQTAWLRSLSWPWTTLAHPRGFHGYLTRIDGAVLVLFAALGLAGLAAFQPRAVGLLLVLLVLPPLTSGTLMSGTRFMAVAFPAFVLLARLGEEPLVDRAYLFLAIALQAVFMAAWSQLYWLG